MIGRFALAIVVMTCSRVVAAEAPATQPAKPLHPATLADTIGIAIHFTHPAPGELEMMSAAGVRWVRTDLSWEGQEKSRGVYDFSGSDALVNAIARQHMRAMFIFDYANPLYDDGLSPRTDEGRAAFARWAASAAERYKGRGFIWEMYNEPNIFFWRPKPDTQAYIALARRVGEEMRLRVPGETFVGPAEAGSDPKFLADCFDAGLLDDWAGVSVHPYRKLDPETFEDEVPDLRKLIEAKEPKGKSVLLFTGEWGFSSVWKDFDESRQAKCIAREFLFNAAEGMPLTIWYDWRDDGTDPKESEHHFGIVYSQLHKGSGDPYAPKPAYIALKTLNQQLGDYTFERRLTSGDAAVDFVLRFRRGSTGETKIAAWTTDDNPHPVKLPMEAGIYSCTSMLGDRQGIVASKGGEADVRLSDSVSYFAREPMTESTTQPNSK